MLKRIKFSFFTWLFLGFILLSGFIFSVESVQIRKAKIDAQNYKDSNNCSNASACKEIVVAKVITSNTIKSTQKIYIHKSYSKDYIRISYYVRLRLQNSGTHDTIILPNLNIDDDFNVPNIYFPTGSIDYENFAEHSIPENAILNVEIWNGEPTIIFTKYINVDFVVIDNLPVFLPSETIQSENETEDWIEYAIPTANNPLVKLHLLQDKFNQTLTFITVSGIFIVGLKLFVNLR